MRFLVISDIHGAIENIEKLSLEFESADAVLFAGDFAKFGEVETGEPTLNALCKKHDEIFAVLGNCDEPSFIEKLEKNDISVEKTVAFFDSLAIRSFIEHGHYFVQHGYDFFSTHFSAYLCEADNVCK